MSTNEDDMSKRRTQGEPQAAGGSRVVISKDKHRGGPVPIGAAKNAAKDPDAMTQRFTVRQAQDRIAEAESHAVVSGAVDETIESQRPEMGESAVHLRGGRLAPARRENPRVAAERARREAEQRPGEPVFPPGALDAARNAAEEEPTNHDHPLSVRVERVEHHAPMDDHGEDAPSLVDDEGSTPHGDARQEHPEIPGLGALGAANIGVREAGYTPAPVESDRDMSTRSLDAGVVGPDGVWDEHRYFDDRAVTSTPFPVGVGEPLPADDDITEDHPLEPLPEFPIERLAEQAPAAMPAPESMSDEMRAAYGGPAAVADLHARRAAAEPAPRMPAPEPATAPAFDEPDSDAVRTAMITGAPIAYPRRENPAASVPAPDAETLRTRPTSAPAEPARRAPQDPSSDEAVFGTAAVAAAANRPADTIRVSRASAERATDTRRRLAEGGPSAALDSMRARTDERERALVAKSPWKRRLLYGLLGAAAVVGAALGGWELSKNRAEGPVTSDKDLVVDQAPGDESKAPDSGPAAPEAAKPVEHTRAIGNGEGVSQAMLGAGVAFDQMMQGLKLPVAVGDKTAQLKDTFVIARGNELGIKVKQDAAGTVTGVDFYKVGAEGATLSAQELSKYLAIADWREIQAERNSTASSDGGSWTDTGAWAADQAAFDARYPGVSVAPGEGVLDQLQPGQQLREVDVRDIGSIVGGTAPAAPYDLPVEPVSGGTVYHHPDPYGAEPARLASFDPSSRIPERFRPTPLRYNDRALPFVDMDSAGTHGSSVDHDAPTAPLAREVGAQAGKALNGAAETRNLKASWMPQVYERHMEALEDNLDVTPGRTTHVGDLEFRRVGLSKPEYQVRFDGEKAWSVLDAKMMEKLYSQYGLDFRDPEKMRKITKIEFAAVLPDGNPTKIAVIRSLETMINQAPLLGMDPSYFKQEYKQVTGKDFDAARLVDFEAPTEPM